jgi:regulation of enolase protein 1 (concanavalin A-like superfamily)
MNRLVLAFALGCAGAGVVAAPVPKENDAARMLRIYGTTVDPDKDCAFEMAGEKLRIMIPAKHHSRSLNSTQWNAPRVARVVEGDFTVTVRVAFPIRPLPGPDADESEDRFATAGLVVWEDNGETVWVTRSESHAVDRQERFGWNWWLNGSNRLVSVAGFDKVGEAAYLRLARKGPKLTTNFSRDGKEWTPDTRLGVLDVGWTGPVRVGVIAENGYRATFEAAFDEYRLTRVGK